MLQNKYFKKKYVFFYIIIIVTVLYISYKLLTTKNTYNSKLELFVGTAITNDTLHTMYSWIYTDYKLDLTSPLTYNALIGIDGIVESSIDDKYIVYDKTYNMYNIIYSPTNKIAVLPSHPGFYLDSESTISFWIKPYTIDKLCPIICKTVPDYFIFQDNKDIIIKIYGREQNKDVFFIERWVNILEADIWINIIISWNRSTFKLYKNGNVMPSTNKVFTRELFLSVITPEIGYESIAIGGTHNLYFNKFIIGDDYTQLSKFSYYFNGNITNFRTYNDAIHNEVIAKALFLSPELKLNPNYNTTGYTINLFGALKSIATPITTAPTTTKPITTAPTTTKPITTAPTTTKPITTAPTTTNPITTGYTINLFGALKSIATPITHITTLPTTTTTTTLPTTTTTTTLPTTTTTTTLPTTTTTTTLPTTTTTTTLPTTTTTLPLTKSYSGSTNTTTLPITTTTLPLTQSYSGSTNTTTLPTTTTTTLPLTQSYSGSTNTTTLPTTTTLPLTKSYSGSTNTTTLPTTTTTLPLTKSYSGSTNTTTLPTTTTTTLPLTQSYSGSTNTTTLPTTTTTIIKTAITPPTLYSPSNTEFTSFDFTADVSTTTLYTTTTTPYTTTTPKTTVILPAQTMHALCYELPQTTMANADTLAPIDMLHNTVLSQILLHPLVV